MGEPGAGQRQLNGGVISPGAIPPPLARRLSLGEWSLIAALAVLVAFGASWAVLAYLAFPLSPGVFVGGFCGLPLLIFFGGVALASRARRVAERHVRLTLSKATVAPGEEVAATVTLQLDRPVRIRSLSVRCRGTENVHVSAGETDVSETRTILDTERTPLPSLPGRNAHLLQPGSHAFRAAFRLPSDAPPSHAGILVIVEYEVEVHVDIVRALDFVLDRTVRVAAPTWVSPAASTEEDAEKRTASPVSLRLEVPEEVPVGGRIQGRVLVENPEGKPVRKVTVSFGHLEAARAKGRSERRFIPIATTTVRPGGTEPLPFQLEVPRKLPQPYQGRSASVRFAVQARADVAIAVYAFATRTIVVRSQPSAAEQKTK